MERDKIEAPVVELGVASVATQGGLGELIETMGLWHKAGIAEE